MGKNHKHKKQLKSEKAKVKLKVRGEKTKFLPKGANVTNTTFKVKSIVVQEQLRAKNEEEPLSKRKLNVPELLLRLKHHNVSAKKESCIELRQIIAVYSEEILQKHFSQLLHDVCPLILDRDNGIRKESVKLIDTMLENTNLEKISPFFNVLSSYIRCAMTDIDVSVQEDSLLLLDVLLKRAPNLVAQNSDKILTNFFPLLSKFGNSKNERILTTHMSQKMTSVKWRTKVFLRLHRLLEAVVLPQKDAENDQEAMDIDVHVDASKTNTFAIKSSLNVLQKCPINFLNHQGTLKTEENEGNIEKHVQILLPLLHETWLEVLPEDKKINIGESGTILNQESATILSCVTNILYSLIRYVKSSKHSHISLWFGSNEMQKFLSCLLKHFPYSQTEANKLKKSKKDIKNISVINEDVKCIQENLIICYIFSTLNSNLQNKHAIECASDVIEFLRKCLVTRNYVLNTDLDYLLSTLRVILINNCKKWTKKQAPLIGLLEDFITFYNNTNSNTTAKIKALNMLCDVMELTELNNAVKYQVWISTLPALLCNQEVSEKIVNTLSFIAKQGNNQFNNALVKQLPLILENVTKIRIIGAKNYKLALLKIVGLFYYVPVLYREDLEHFLKFLTVNEGSFVCDYVKEMLKLRYDLKESEHTKSTFVNICGKYIYF